MLITAALCAPAIHGSIESNTNELILNFTGGPKRFAGGAHR
jgi:hypothetical protein